MRLENDTTRRLARLSDQMGVSGDGQRSFDYRFGHAVAVETEEFREPTSQWRRLKRPANSHPAHPQQPSAQRDLADNRLIGVNRARGISYWQSFSPAAAGAKTLH